MRWTIFFILAVLVVQSTGDFVSDANALIAHQKTVRLDPILRRALLKALTELEEEAQLKAKEEEEKSRALAEGNFQVTENSNPAEHPVLENHQNADEIQSTADSTYPTVNPLTVQDTVTPSSEVSSTTEENTAQPEQPTNQPITIQDTFFFQTPSPLESDKAKLQAAPSNDIETNLITDDNEVKPNKTPEPQPNQLTSSTSQPSSTSKGSDNDVDIFKAPLVAAFTLHQDSKGTPHSIIPLFKAQEQDKKQLQNLQQSFQVPQQQIFQSQAQQLFQNQLQNFQQQQVLQQIQQQSLGRQPFQQQVFIQPSQQAAAFTFNPNQQFQQGQFALSNQFPVNSFFSQQFIPSQGPFGNNQQPNINQFSVPNGQQQLPSFQTPIPFQQNIPSVTVTPLSQPHNLNSNNFNFPSSTAFPPVTSNSIVPSQGFQISSTPNPLDLGFSSTARPVSGFPSSTPQSAFTIPSVTLPLANEGRFQSPIVVQQSIDQSSKQFAAEQELARQRQVAAEQDQARQRQIAAEQDQARQRQIAADQEQARQRQIAADQEQARQRQIAADQEQARQRQIAEQNRLRQLEEQARYRQLELQNRQREIELLAGQGPDQFRTQRQQPSGLSFQRSVGFQFNPNPFQFQPPSANRVNRQEGFGSTGNFGFNNQQYRTIPDDVYRQRNFRSPQQQLAQLLFQSGVTTDASGQEDLNIVSKVLALNHERSDANIQESQRSSPKQEKDSFSQPINANGFQPISRSDLVDGAKTERKAEEKTLLVGEIKDFTGGR